MPDPHYYYLNNDQRYEHHWLTSNGDRRIYSYGMLHYKNGPAVKTEDGWQLYFSFGLLHREDGPAVISPGYNNRKVEYWLDGKELSPDEYILYLARKIDNQKWSFKTEMRKTMEAFNNCITALEAEQKRSNTYRKRAITMLDDVREWKKIANGHMKEVAALGKKLYNAKGRVMEVSGPIH